MGALRRMLAAGRWQRALRVLVEVGSTARGSDMKFHLLRMKCQVSFTCPLTANLCVGVGGKEGSTGQIQSSRKADPGRGQYKLPQSWSSPAQSLPCAEVTSSLGHGEGGREGGWGYRRTLLYINGLFLLSVSSAEPWPLSGALLPWQIS